MTQAEDLWNVTGVILVGGRSRRMGRDKILLPVNGVPIISTIHDKLESLFQHILVIGHHRPEFDDLNITSHDDILPNCGVLGGIYTALALSNTPYIFTVAGDMPNLSEELIAKVARHRSRCDAVIPRSASGMEPLFAVYSRTCRDPIRENLEAGQLKVLRALGGMKVDSPMVPEPPEGSPDPFANINTPEDLELLKK